MTKTQPGGETIKLDFLIAVDKLLRAADEAKSLRDRLLGEAQVTDAKMQGAGR